MEVKNGIQKSLRLQDNNGMVIVLYGQDEHNNDMHRIFLGYDSLADVKNTLKARGVKNISYEKNGNGNRT